MPEEHIRALDQYRLIAPFLPPRDASLTAPYLWHTDLHGKNIFVSSIQGKAGKSSYHITDIIDWQHTAVAPLYLHARVPAFIERVGPEELPTNSTMPRYPENSSALSEKEKERVDREFYRQAFYYYWVQMTVCSNHSHYAALSDPACTLRTSPTRLAGHTWGHMWGNELLPFRSALLDVVDNWEAVAGSAVDGDHSLKCPINYSLDERERLELEMDEWNDGRLVLLRLMDMLGVDSQTFVHSGDVATVRAVNEELRRQFVNEGRMEEREEMEAAWPFYKGMQEL